MTLTRFAAFALLAAMPMAGWAHDPWVQTNTHIVRAGDVVHADLMLGNHGNHHRDFKLAGKLDLASSTFEVIGPDGAKYDLRPDAVDQGYTPKDGYWTARFGTGAPGIYTFTSLTDRVVTYAPERVLKGAKAFVLASTSLDRPVVDEAAAKAVYGRAVGHPLELVPESNPLAPMGPGTPLTVRLLYKGKPMPGAVVSFIPRGATLKGEVDPEHELKTDAEGRVTFTPKEGNVYLMAAHHKETADSGPNYEFTGYAATLTVMVPQICPCCE